MSDYLMNVAAKALNLVPVVQPRPTSLFEPEVGVRHPTAGLEPEPDDLADDWSPDGTASPVQLTDGRVRSQEIIAAAPAERRQVLIPAAPAQHPPATSADPPLHRPLTAQPHEGGLVTSHPHSASRPLSPFSDHSGDEASSRRQRLPQVTRGQGVENTVASAVPSEGKRSGEADLDGRLSHAAKVDVTLHATPTPVTERVEEAQVSGPTRRDPVTVTIVAQSATAPVAEPTAPMRDEPMTTPPASVIRVSIGRIEVRAIMSAPSAAPRPKASRPSPGLSLEEYLKQRQRGQR
jgi:hypothetical protein